MSLIRARQHVLTGLFPHQGNRSFLIPKRRFKLTTPPGFNGVYTMTGQVTAEPYYGFGTVGVPSGAAFGTIAPTVTAQGDRVLALFANAGAYVVAVWGSAGTDHGIESITIVFDALAPLVMTFDGYGYVGQSVTVRDYLISKVGVAVACAVTVQP